MYAYLHLCICVRAYVYNCICVLTCICVYLRAFTYMSLCLRICVFIYVPMHPYICTHVSPHARPQMRPVSMRKIIVKYGHPFPARSPFTCSSRICMCHRVLGDNLLRTRTHGHFGPRSSNNVINHVQNDTIAAPYLTMVYSL